MRAPLLLFALLSACAPVDEAAYPSLSRRAAEAIDPRLPVSVDRDARPVSTGLTDQVNGIVARGESAFADLRAAAVTTPPVRGTPGSEAWIAGQERLSALEAKLGPLVAALADLDALMAERVAARRLSDADRALIDAAQAQLGERRAAAVALIDARR